MKATVKRLSVNNITTPAKNKYCNCGTRKFYDTEELQHCITAKVSDEDFRDTAKIIVMFSDGSGYVTDENGESLFNLVFNFCPYCGKEYKRCGWGDSQDKILNS